MSVVVSQGEVYKKQRSMGSRYLVIKVKFARSFTMHKEIILLYFRSKSVVFLSYFKSTMPGAGSQVPILLTG